MYHEVSPLRQFLTTPLAPSISPSLPPSLPRYMFVLVCFVGQQVTTGSMWDQEDDEDESKPVEKYLVKWKGMSYLHVSWETTGDLIELTTQTMVKSQVGWHPAAALRVGPACLLL